MSDGEGGRWGRSISRESWLGRGLRCAAGDRGGHRDPDGVGRSGSRSAPSPRLPRTRRGRAPRSRTSRAERWACRGCPGAARIYHPCRWRGSRSGAQRVSRHGAPVRGGAARGRAVHDDLGRGGRAAVDAGDDEDRLRARPRLPGVVSVHARRLPVDVPRPALDDASVRRLRDGEETYERSGTSSTTARRAVCAFDMPALMGVDSDSPRAVGEVGRGGVAVASLEDIEILFSADPARRGLDLDDDQLVGGDRARDVPRGRRGAGVPRERLRGTIQTDILKEYIAQKEFIFPPGPSMRLVTDMIEFCSREMPLWHPISISGYHIREAGSTAAQELAFTLKNGVTYVEWALERGLDVDAFARGSRSSSTRTSTSSRRSRSTAPRGGSGRARCAIGMGTGRALAADAVPHADRGGLADPAAAARQRRADGDRGARGRPRRDAVAAHELLRRGARAADQDAVRLAPARSR